MKILIDKLSSNSSIYYIDNDNTNNDNRNNEHAKLVKKESKKTKSILQQKSSLDNNSQIFRNYFANRANSLTDTKQIKSVSYSFNKQNLSDMLLVAEGKYESDSNSRNREAFVKSNNQEDDANSYTNFGDDADLDELDDERELYYEYEYEEEINQINNNNNNYNENQLIKFRLPSTLKHDSNNNKSDDESSQSIKTNNRTPRSFKKKLKKNSYMHKYLINAIIQNNLKNLTQNEIKKLKSQKFKSDSQLFSNQNSNLNLFLTKTSNTTTKQYQRQQKTSSNIDNISANSNTNTNMLINFIDLISKSELVNLNKIESNQNNSNINNSNNFIPSTNSARLDFSGLRDLSLEKKPHLVTSTSDSNKLESSPIKNSNEKDDSNLSIDIKKENEKSCSIQLTEDE